MTMRITSFMMVIIFTVVGLNAFVYQVYGKCMDECREKCDATVDEKFRSGEGYIKGIEASTDYLKMKNQQKVKCYGKCEEECTQSVKEGTADTDSELKKEPKER
jgi:hypothetical protein